MHEIFREGVRRLITFLVNSEKPRNAQHGGRVCCALAPQLVFKILINACQVSEG